MNTNKHEWIRGDLAYQIVGAAMDVHNELGAGFLEKVYENALVIALRERGLECRQQAALEVRFHGQIGGEYFVDILVENQVILELKVVKEITEIHEAQVMNYLRATNLRLAIILNFARPKLQSKRIVL
jgi:GxxExxY protein